MADAIRKRHAMRGQVALVGLAALLACAAPARAQSALPSTLMSPGEDAGLLLPLLIRGAALTPEQETKVRDIIAARRASTHALLAQLRQAQHDLADKLFAPGALQETDLAAHLQQIEQLRTQLLQESTRVALEVRAILTAEQLTKAAQVKDRMRTLQSEMRQILQPVRP
jgi:Spy/CpxP family protein refolding chaperone